MCRRVPSEVRVLTWYRSQACGTFLEHSGSMRSLPEHSGTFLESFLGRFHRTQACGTFLEHSSKASSGASTGLRHAERSWNIPEHSSDVRYRPHTSRTASLFLIVDDRSDPVHFFFINLSRRYIVDRFRQMYGIGHTRQTAPHPVRSVKLSCLGPG